MASSQIAFLYWALIGVVGAPISMVISNPALRESYNKSSGLHEDSKKEIINEDSKSEIPKDSQGVTEPAPKPALVEKSNPPMPSNNGWNSDSIKAELESSIKSTSRLQATGVDQPVSSVSCSALSQVGFWECSIRFLGIPEAIKYRIERSEDGNWAGQPVYESEYE